MRWCCDEDGACCTKTRRCRYHCPCPPLLLDTIYHRFREPCLSIICILIIVAFGTSNVYKLKPLTCDKMYIVDPKCDENSYEINGVNYTKTYLISQNKVFYEGGSLNKYNNAHQIDTLSTFILLVGNSPYHSPVWLVIGFMSSMYSTYIYTDSIKYCSDDYCKTKENDRYYIPDECYQPIYNYIRINLLIDEEQIQVCSMDTDTYSLCKYCQCLSDGIDSCKQYMDRNLFDRLHVLMSYFWFILIYLRQTVAFIVMIKIMYRKCTCFGKKHEEESLLQLELIQNMNVNNNEPNIVQQDDSKNEETLTGTSGLIEMETINDNELMVAADIKNTNRNICMLLRKMHKVFTDPLSVRLIAASCISIIMLIVICQIVDDISNNVCVTMCTLLLPGDNHTFFINLIMSLLRIAGTICIFVYLRSVWMMHHQFSSDVAAVYAYYNGVDENDDDVVADNNGDDNAHNADNKILTKLKSLIVKLFPVHIASGPHIIDHVKKCRIMNAYLFIFMYPVSIMAGWIILFITMAIPIMLVASIIVISWLYTFGTVLEFIWHHFEDIWKMIFVPLLGIIIFDRCILRGNTHQILTQRKVNCLWYITLVDIASTMAAALFITLWNIFVVRMIYSIGIFCYGLMSPYKSAFPTPFEKYDKVYQTYCANVALAALALLKSNENKVSGTDN